jgi:DNA-binding PadR family transcriptional regulator
MESKRKLPMRGELVDGYAGCSARRCCYRVVAAKNETSRTFPGIPSDPAVVLMKVAGKRPRELIPVDIYIRRGYITAMAEIDPDAFVPLTPAVFHILLALADGERHGYAIMRSVAESSDKKVTMGPGTLYGTIKRMLAAGLIEESEERPDPALDDERRRYDRLTGLGQRVASAEARRHLKLVQVARAKRLIEIAHLRGAEA